MRNKERVVVFGASNAAGWTFNTRGVDYHCSNIIQAALEKPPFVRENPEGLIIDLSENPKLEEGEFVINAAFPGDTVFELMERFDSEVLAQQPSHLFFWSGLNDIVIAINLLHNPNSQYELEQEYENAVREFKNAFSKVDDIDSSLTTASGVIYKRIKDMVTLARNNNIQTLVGTIPPFSATLAQWEQDPSEPHAKHFRKEGTTLIGLVNDRIRILGLDDCAVDAFKLVVDEKTGLTKAEYSYGVTVPNFQGDILHINSMGQIQVAQVLCERVVKKPVTIVPPNSTKLQKG